jgi:putative restriction endonuclease
MPFIGDNILLNYYRDLILQINRGVSAGGIKINAKPIMLISIFDMIADGLLTANKLYLTKIEPLYSNTYKQLQPEKTKTPIHKPYFHLSSEPFYHLNWTNKTSYNISRISAKFVRDNIEYAYFDNALWDLLQEPEVRQKLREALVSHFLTR